VTINLVGHHSQSERKELSRLLEQCRLREKGRLQKRGESLTLESDEMVLACNNRTQGKWVGELI